LPSFTAWDAIGYDGDGYLRVVGGRTLYETAIFYDHTHGQMVKLVRLDTTDGRLRQINRYVSPDTPLEVVYPEKSSLS